MKCPNRNFHDGEQTISTLECGLYSCSCGCQFEWFNDFAWRVLIPGHKKVIPYVTNPTAQLQERMIKAWMLYFGGITAVGVLALLWYLYIISAK